MPDILAHLPEGVGSRYTKYIEPFVGGGALLFELLERFHFEQVLINDMNSGLINAYQIVQQNVDELINTLNVMQEDYYKLDTLQKKQQMFYDARNNYNEFLTDENLCNNKKVEFASYFILLNKTCFNGMYRVNSRGLYNVPFGKHERPLICDVNNLQSVSKSLEKVTILHGDYEQVQTYVDEYTLVYFDPPYRPITDTSSFTAYTNDGFGDYEQRSLAKFSHSLSQKGAKVILSNSDPKNHQILDYFFDDIYNWAFVRRLQANRNINSNGNKRGRIREILVTNYRIGGVHAK